MCSGRYSSVIDPEALVRYHALMEREKRDKLCALYTSAEELAYLRPLVGAVSSGESFGEIRDTAKKPSKP